VKEALYFFAGALFGIAVYFAILTGREPSGGVRSPGAAPSDYVMTAPSAAHCPRSYLDVHEWCKAMDGTLDGDHDGNPHCLVGELRRVKP